MKALGFFFLFCVFFGGEGILIQMVLFWSQNCINRTSRSIKKKENSFVQKKMLRRAK